MIYLYLLPLLLLTITTALSPPYIPLDTFSIHSQPIPQQIQNLGIKVASNGDFNGDGRSDILFAGKISPSIPYVWLYLDSFQDLNFTFFAPINPPIGMIRIKPFSADISATYPDSLEFVGDINNDGYDDFVIGNIAGQYFGRIRCGGVWLVYGSNSTGGQEIELDESPVAGVATVFYGANDFDYIGYSVSRAGDINNDTFDDFLIGGSGVDPSGPVGEVYLIYGNTSFVQVFDLTSVDGTNGVRFLSLGGEHTGFGKSLSAIGDFDKDGLPDIAIGCSNYPPDIGGKVFVVYGNTSFPHPFNITTMVPSQGFSVDGYPTDYLGSAISSAGDFNNDGFADILIGCERCVYGSGFGIIIFGNSLYFSNYNLITSLGLRIFGFEDTFQLGRQVSSAGDVNNDGFDDILISSPQWKSTFHGITALIYGSDAGFSDIFLANLTVSQGVFFVDTFPWAYSGTQLAPLGDINNDGFDDFAISSPAIGSDGKAKIDIILGTNLAIGKRDDITRQILPCPPGTNTKVPPFTFGSCYPCQLGTSSNTYNNLACPLCVEGTYGNDTGMVECLKCEPGTFQSRTGMIDSSECNQCPPGSYSASPGSEFCTFCPSPGSVCPESGTIRPLPSPGYQIIPGTVDQFIACIPKEACPGGSFTKCTLGYSNPTDFCSECSPGWYRNQEKCFKCPENAIDFLSLFCVFYTLFIIALVPLSAQGHRFGISAMFASLFQFISLFKYININPPDIWISTFDILSASLFSFEVAAPECSTGVQSFYTSFYLQVLSPFFSLFLLVLSYPLLLLIQKLWGVSHTDADAEADGDILPNLDDTDLPDYTTTTTTTTTTFTRIPGVLKSIFSNLSLFLYATPKELRSYLRSGAVFALTLLYTIVTKSAISVLDCVSLIPGRSVIESYPSLTCTGAEWDVAAAVAIIMIIFYTIGLPLFAFLFVHKHAKSGDLSNTKKLVYSCFLDKYKPEFTYWEPISLIRRAILLVAALMFSHEFFITVAIFFLVLLLSLIYQIRKQPFWTPWLNYFELMIFIASSIILTLSLFVYNQPNDTTLFILSCINILVIVGSIVIGIYLAVKQYSALKSVKRHTKGASTGHKSKMAERKSKIKSIQQ